MHAAVKRHLFFMGERSEGAAFVGEPNHEVEVIHVQTGVLVEVADVFHNLVYALEMLVEDCCRRFLAVGKALQQFQVVQDALQGGLIAGGATELFVQRERQVKASAHRYVVALNCFYVAVDGVKIRFDVGPTRLETRLRDNPAVLAVIRIDIGDEAGEVLARQAGDLAAVQAEREGHYVRLAKFGYDGIERFRGIRERSRCRTAVVLEVTIATAQVAFLRGNIEQMDEPRNGAPHVTFDVLHAPPPWLGWERIQV